MKRLRAWWRRVRALVCIEWIMEQERPDFDLLAEALRQAKAGDDEG